jgi:pimeloyl-ACP methyl ester carboxylesterase
MGDLHGDAAHVAAVLDALSGPVVLVGLAYGGAVITEAGSHRAVSHLVYWQHSRSMTVSRAATWPSGGGIGGDLAPGAP